MEKKPAIQRSTPDKTLSICFEGWALRERYLDTHRLLRVLNHRMANDMMYVSGTVSLASMLVEDPEMKATLLKAENHARLVCDQLREAVRTFVFPKPETAELINVPCVIGRVMHREVNNQVQCDIHLPSQCNAFVDRTLLEQAISALVRNALEAKASAVSVGCSIVDNDMSLVVADNGIGIRKDQADLLLTPFLTTKGSDHIGLGLCRVGMLVAELGGRLRITSGTTGTEVRLMLPQAFARLGPDFGYALHMPEDGYVD